LPPPHYSLDRRWCIGALALSAATLLLMFA
jgi:hypothetical protein